MRQFRNEVHDGMEHLCTGDTLEVCHEKCLLQQCVTMTSMFVLAPPTAQQKAKEKQTSNEMKEQAKKRENKHGHLEALHVMEHCSHSLLHVRHIAIAMRNV